MCVDLSDDFFCVNISFYKLPKISPHSQVCTQWPSAKSPCTHVLASGNHCSIKPSVSNYLSFLAIGLIYFLRPNLLFSFFISLFTMSQLMKANPALTSLGPIPTFPSPTFSHLLAHFLVPTKSFNCKKINFTFL